MRTEAQKKADRKYEAARYEKTTQLKCTIQKEVAEIFKTKLENEGLSVNSFFKNVVEEYIKEN